MCHYSQNYKVMKTRLIMSCATRSSSSDVLARWTRNANRPPGACSRRNSRTNSFSKPGFKIDVFKGCIKRQSQPAGLRIQIRHR